MCARRQFRDRLSLAREYGVKGLEFYQNFTSIDFALNKMGAFLAFALLLRCLTRVADLVAVPSFSAGAMENWGLITFRESRLLFDKEIDQDTVKQVVRVD